MPMYHDHRPDTRQQQHVPAPPGLLHHRASEESIRTEFCDGPVLDRLAESPPPSEAVRKVGLGRQEEEEEGIGSREELIRRLKRGERPTWVSSYTPVGLPESFRDEAPRPSPPPMEPVAESLPPLVGPFRRNVQPVDGPDAGPDPHGSRVEAASEIERPRSALHAGDFTHDAGRARSAFEKDPRFPPLECPPGHRIQPGPLRRRPSSLQFLSSAYVLKVPTSPLVQQYTNDDPDPPPSPPGARQPLGQGHRARRSLASSWTCRDPSSPQTPSLSRSRRLSLSSDASPRFHASMVGSYEESILRGRMSGNPSRPLNFTAQIGALGRAGCRPKMPAHVTVDFPAVYYSWNAGNGRVTSVDDEPSPYVGQIDLEHGLPPPPATEKRRGNGAPVRPPDPEDATAESPDHGRGVEGRREKRKRRSPSPEAPPSLGGCYRIPRQGSLQILIKNPNKTAVKLFLVPYDLAGMEAGTKTFVRQRCRSAGPIIDRPISSGLPASGPGPGTRPSAEPPKGRPTLRYLVHVKICCPSRGRFYLYGDIRIVFANRVPDNKENLRNEVQLPDPRYTPFKNPREPSTPGLPPPPPSPPSKHAADMADRRRSLGCYTRSERPFPAAPSSFVIETVPTIPPVPFFPFDFGPSTRVPLDADDEDDDDDDPALKGPMDVDPPRKPSCLAAPGGQSPGSGNASGSPGNFPPSSYRSASRTRTAVVSAANSSGDR